MYIQELRQSRNILIQMVVAIVLTIALGVYFSDVLAMIYFSNQQTSSGYALNGLILVLFMLAMIRIIMLLFAYHREEQALFRFRMNFDQNDSDLLASVPPNSIIARRVVILEQMSSKQAVIDHQALAAILVAYESTRTGLIHFIHNILILCGVLGTIVSLSIALLGASSMLEQTVSSNGMGMVIHGMSTALSTTMTAVVCYLFVTYFFSALQNMQTHVLGDIEQLTTTRLLPMYQVTGEVVTQHALDLVKEALLLVQSLNQKVKAIDMTALQEGIHQATTQAQLQHEEMIGQLGMLLSTIQHGFRLPKA